MALGSSCFRLLFLGSGSTFGSTSPALPARRFCPLLSVLILWAANPKGIAYPRRDTRQAKRRNHRADPSFGLPVAAFPASSVRPTPRSWPRNCVARKTQQPRPFPTGGSETEFEFRTRGTTFSELPTEGFVRWQTREAFTDGACRSMVPSDWEGKHSRNLRQLTQQYPISYYNELFVWNQACQRQPVHFHLIGAETQIGRRTPSIVQSNR
jgi:hypothetical protein